MLKSEYICIAKCTDIGNYMKTLRDQEVQAFATLFKVVSPRMCGWCFCCA